MNRRMFLHGLMAAPLVVAAANLMPVRGIIMPLYLTLHGDGMHDDSKALQAMLRREPVWHKGEILGQPKAAIYFPPGNFRTNTLLWLAPDAEPR